MTRAFLEENLASPDRGRSVLTVKVPERKPHSAPGRDTVFCRNSTTCRMPKEPSTTAHNWSVASMLAGHAISSWSFTMGLSEQRNTTCEKRRTTTARRTLPSPLVFSCKLLHLTLLLTVLLVDIPLGSSAQQRDNKTPLISTQANSSSEFRELFGVPLGRSTTDNRADADTLDFQTMKYIKEWGNTTDILLVIGKNHIYMMDSNKPHNSLNHFRERLTWKTSVKSQRECVLMGKKKYECRNYIRVAEVMQNGELMVCGTNAYSPTCRYYKREQFNEPKPGDDSDPQSETPCRDQCIVPYNPATASATLYTKTANGFHVFTAVLNDFLSNDPIIFKRGTTSLYTNPMWLNDPTFLKMVEYGDKVYVFFREIAKESESGTTEKVTYARVAQICKDDKGGVNVLAKQWTSFLKARLLCGYPGRQHLQFNNMTSVSDIVTIKDENGNDSDAVIASFTTPWQWTDASLSAVCVFAMKDIISLFETGSFSGEYVLDAKPKEKPEMPSMGRPSFAARASIKKITRSYPVPEIETPEKRPGRCGASLDAKYDPSVLSFAKEHPLMYDAVNPFFGGPVFVTYNNVRATQITVDEIGISGSNYTMIYLGTENGEVMRLRAMFSQQGPKAVLIETTTTGGACTGDNCSIRSMYVSRPAPDTNSEPSLFVAFSHNVVQFPISRCHQYSNERCCSVDPDCGWTGEGCVPRTSQKSSSLQPISRDISRLPTTCQTSTHVSTVGCNCEGGLCTPVQSGESQVPVVTDIMQDLLDMVKDSQGPQVSLRDILLESLLPTVQDKYTEILDKLHNPSQRTALVTQLTQALKDTTQLVLNNHQQEYCLPSPTVNHLTHVYPLLLREIELWHQTALKKMSEHEFANNCWGKGAPCFHKVSFSVPLVPILWEPLTKLISDFYGECETITSSGGHPTSHLHHHDTGHGCTPHPGMEKCRDAHSPLCQPKRCTFPRYAVDVKAFFRHVNDSRQFLEHSDRIEPLWKPVNVTLENSGIRGHLELAVSERRPFLIDYSPVAEKVKIIFHYSAVQDCSLTEPRCVGTLPGCNPEVEEVVDHWFDLAMSKISVKLRRCSREINKAKRLDARDRRRREKRGGSEHRPELSDRSEFVLHSTLEQSNLISPSTHRCKRITSKVGNVKRNLWSLIVSRCQRSGGVFSPFHSSIKFYKLGDVIKFFKNMCTFLDPTKERKTFRKRAARGRSGSEVQIQVMVSRETPFVIERNVSTGKTVVKYFTTEHLE